MRPSAARLLAARVPASLGNDSLQIQQVAARILVGRVSQSVLHYTALASPSPASTIASLLPAEDTLHACGLPAAPGPVGGSRLLVVGLVHSTGSSAGNHVVLPAGPEALVGAPRGG